MVLEELQESELVRLANLATLMTDDEWYHYRACLGEPFDGWTRTEFVGACIFAVERHRPHCGCKSFQPGPNAKCSWCGKPYTDLVHQVMRGLF